MSFQDVFSKDIVLAIFGLAISLTFTRSLFDRIVQFIVELSTGIFQFGFNPLPDGNERITKADIAAKNSFERAHAARIQRIYKSIMCNSAISMAMLFFIVFVFTLKSVGLHFPIEDIIWNLIIFSIFVYASYFLWSLLRTDKLWDKDTAMSISRYDLMISLSIVLSSLHYFLADGTFNGSFSYLICSIIFIYCMTRFNRIPHFHSLDGRDVGISADEEYYLRDIGREKLSILAVFLFLFYTNHFFGVIIKGYIKLLDLNFNNSSMYAIFGLLSLPYIIFFISFIRNVNIMSVVHYLTHFKKPDFKSGDRGNV